MHYVTIKAGHNRWQFPNSTMFFINRHCHNLIIFAVNQELSNSSSKNFYCKCYKCFKKKISMHGKPAMTCFKYQMYLYGSGALTYLNAILWGVTDLQLWVIRLPPHPTTGSPPPPPQYESITFTQLKENFSMVKLPMLKSKGKPVWLRSHHM